MKADSRGDGRRRLSELVYSRLLWVYPAAFRRLYGGDIEAMFRDTMLERSRVGGSWPRIWVKTILDVLGNACALHIARLRGRPPFPPRRPPEHSNGRGKPMMDNLFLDVRFALRTLTKQKGFTAVALLTIALGIGANSAIFSVVNSVLLRPLPFDNPDRLVMVWTQFLGDSDRPFAISGAEYLDYRAESLVFDDMGAFGRGMATMTDAEGAERVSVVGASAALFDVLGLQTVIGRRYGPDEDRPGNSDFVVIGHSFWRNRFGADSSIIGRTLTLDDRTFQVLGVMQEGANPPGAEVDLWLPLGIERSQFTNRSGHGLNVVARLAPGASLEAAKAELQSILVRWSEIYVGLHPNDLTNHPLLLIPLNEQILGQVRPAMLILTGAVGLVLLLACANIANLLLARGETRQREIGLRTALGAGRGRITRQLLTESVMLSLGGGALGLALSFFGIALLPKIDPGNIPRLANVSLDARVLVFTALVSVLTGIVFGLLPSLRMSRSEIATVLNAAGRSGGVARDTKNVLSGLVVLQAALSVVLLVGSGLLVKSFIVLQRTDPGFVAEHRIAFDVSLPAQSYPGPETILGFYDAVVDGVEGLPGVNGVALVRNLPLRRPARTEGIEIEGRRNESNDGAYPIDYQGVSPEYFSVLGIPLLQGRMLKSADRGGAASVALINETLARSYMPDIDPVGHRIRALFAGPDTGWITIVGVVGDVRQNTLDAAPRPELYLPMRQTPSRTFSWIRSASVIVQVASGPESLFGAIRDIVRRVDPNVPVANIESLERVVGATLRQDRFIVLLLSAFAMGALLIAGVGVYGIMAFSVTRRTKEIGIRMALGASGEHVRREVIGYGSQLALMGAGVGLAVALVGAKVLESQLYGVGARDPLVLGASVVTVIAVALAGSVIPARRASQVDPNISLRAD